MEIYNTFCLGPHKVARLLTIYIEEAHASDEWFLPESRDVKAGNAIIAAHQSLKERLAAANSFILDKKYPIECVVDSMADHIVDRYNAWPERLYIVLDGVIVYKGGMGPNDYKLNEVHDWLEARYGSNGSPQSKEEEELCDN